MPGQYLSGEEVTLENSVFLEHIHSNVAIVRRHGTSYRRLAFQGSDGHTRFFIVQTGQHFSNNPGASRLFIVSGAMIRGLYEFEWVFLISESRTI